MPSFCLSNTNFELSSLSMIHRKETSHLPLASLAQTHGNKKRTIYTPDFIPGFVFLLR